MATGSGRASWSDLEIDASQDAEKLEPDSDNGGMFRQEPLVQSWRYLNLSTADREERLRRAERMRQGAIESFHWLDARATLCRALGIKSPPPYLEFLKQGCTVHIYDPPAICRGLAPGLQDNISWHGPPKVACVEKDKRLPSRVWVWLRHRVKAVPLEKIRLATNEELVGGHCINEGKNELYEELTSGRLRATEVDDEPLALEDASRAQTHIPKVPSSSSDTSEAEDEDVEGDRETECMAGEAVA